MVESRPVVQQAQPLHRNVQFSDAQSVKVPGEAVLLGVIKALEGRLQQRGLVPGIGKALPCPLWFLAETERNFFLWQRRQSITAESRFEFWIHLPDLVEKRLQQLDRGSEERAKFMSLEQVLPLDDETAEKERGYLLSFKAAVGRILPHAHALSKMALMIEKELQPVVHDREVVILPGKRS